jgi:hypothetical protein
MIKGNMIHLDFKLEPCDYRTTLYSMTFGVRKWRRIVILIVWLFSILGLALSLLRIITVSATMYTCFLLVSVIVFSAWISTEIAIFKYKKKYKKGINIKRRIILDDNKIVLKNRSTDDSESNSWDDVMRIKEIESYYIIGINQTDAIILPKKAISTESERQKVIGLFRSKMGNKFIEI